VVPLIVAGDSAGGNLAVACPSRRPGCRGEMAHAHYSRVSSNPLFPLATTWSQ
jgi:acetyl esterase/lipase